MSQSSSNPESRAEPRRLAPTGGIARSSLTPPDALPGSSENGATPNLSAEGAGRSNKKNASMACEACKVSKRKCDGHQPCSNCTAARKPCNYDPSQDGRRRQSRKRRLDELELRSQALEKLLISLKTSSSSEALQLLNLIKGGASLDQILAFLDSHPGRFSDEARATLSPSPPPVNGQQRRMLTLTELTDNPPFRVSAAPWTTVTDDDFFVSHLVSAYLSWYHWYYHNFDEKLFLGAMSSGNLNSIFCSPFLVNAVLGMGCMFSDHPAVYATPGDPSSRGLHFYNEAYRLWMLEAAKPSLTNIQGFTIMIMTAAFSGKDRVSTMSLKQLEDMIPKLLRQHQKSLQDQTISEDLRRSLVIVQWAAHIYSTGFGTGFLIPPANPKPAVEDPYAAEVWQSHVTPWTPYPLLQDPISLPLHALYHHVCDLYLLVPDAQALAYADFATMKIVEKLNAARKMDARFMGWYQSLAPRFQFEDPSFLTAPPTVDLVLSLHHFRLMVWNWMIPSVKATSQATADSVEGPDAAEQKKADEVIREARGMCLEIVSATTRVLIAADASFGPIFNTLMTAQTAILAASFLLSGNLSSTEEEEMLLQIMRILVRCSRQRNLVKGVTHMLLKTAEDQFAAARGGEVPPGGVSKALVEHLTVIVKDLAWEERDHLSFSSQYPNHVRVKEDPDVQLSQLLETWADLHLVEETLPAEAGIDHEGHGM